MAVISISTTQYGGVSTFGAGFMPTILGTILFFFTLADGLIQYRKNCLAGETLSSTELKSIALVVVAIATFTLFLDRLGFVVCASALIFGLTTLKKPKGKLFNGVFAIVVSSAIYYLFGKVLLVALPAGILG
ncbi:tripartite tricarboxylate transporter TctB family protein [Photobacterium rosenbergii]|uniref:tripartite tricarboxylate transporter TctB family protein n=1 Tax=Photobacterium rosenbergii TaxID=294936 RepID=UPI001C99E091|nr:tripartite tricarboxylate transporter TctB family protein [Photobacterium rosenbergii]MBY5948439.1 tripartite tricarboxylate transporter TctB family protein [Photobacterium rosenbergii]